jgi:hypothetical protein
METCIKVAFQNAKYKWLTFIPHIYLYVFVYIFCAPDSQLSLDIINSICEYIVQNILL